jgi:hypothetical protein
MKIVTNEKKKVKVRSDKVEVKVDFQLVWSFMWRWVVIVMGVSFAIGLLVSIL